MPVVFDTIVVVGTARGTDSSSAASLSRTGASSEEWNACSLRSGRHATPAPRSASASTSTWSSVPLTTVIVGPVSAATSTRAPLAANAARTRASSAATASIRPARAVAIRRARSTTTCSASSRVRTPARHAATYSPRL